MNQMKFTTKNKYKEIIISRLMGIGDTIMLTPLLQGIKRLYPDIKLIMITEKHTLPLTTRMPFIDEAYAFTKDVSTEFFFIKHFWRKDLAYCVDTSYRISAIYALAMIKERIGFPHKRGVYLTKNLKYESWMDKSYEPYVHAMLFKQATGIDVTTLDNWGNFYYPEVTNEERDNVENKFIQGGGSFNEKYIACSLESDTWQKDWPIEKWLELFKCCKKHQLKFVILGVKSKKLNNIAFPDNVIDMRGKTSLIEMGYLVKRANLLIAVCSLFVHVAYAMHTPVIGIYGPQPVWRGAPPNIFAAICSSAECAPCDMLIKGNGHCENPYCMDSITVTKVKTEILRFYEYNGK